MHPRRLCCCVPLACLLACVRPGSRGIAIGDVDEPGAFCPVDDEEKSCGELCVDGDAEDVGTVGRHVAEIGCPVGAVAGVVGPVNIAEGAGVLEGAIRWVPAPVVERRGRRDECRAGGRGGGIGGFRANCVWGARWGGRSRGREWPCRGVGAAGGCLGRCCDGT